MAVFTEMWFTPKGQVMMKISINSERQRVV